MIETVARDGAHTLTLAEQAFLFMVFALGALIKNDGKSESFYKQASSVAFEVVSETSTESASLAFLLGLYQQTTGRISAAWTTLGVVVRIAQALGCNHLIDIADIDHRNVSHWGLSSFHQEFRRRIWANIYILDAYQSVVYGRPLIIQDAECDVVLSLSVVFNSRTHHRRLLTTPKCLPTCQYLQLVTVDQNKWISISHSTNSVE